MTLTIRYAACWRIEMPDMDYIGYAKDDDMRAI